MEKIVLREYEKLLKQGDSIQKSIVGGLGNGNETNLKKEEKMAVYNYNPIEKTIPADDFVDLQRRMNPVTNRCHTFAEIKSAMVKMDSLLVSKPESKIVEAPPCPTCGSSMWVRTGTCRTCTNCGYAGGCG